MHNLPRYLFVFWSNLRTIFIHLETFRTSTWRVSFKKCIKTLTSEARFSSGSLIERTKPRFDSLHAYSYPCDQLSNQFTETAIRVSDTVWDWLISRSTCIPTLIIERRQPSDKISVISSLSRRDHKYRIVK